MALDNTKIKSKTTLEAVLALNKLGENNQVLIIWIPAHSGYLGNEKADSLAKRGANNTDATLLKLPIPKVTWDVGILAPGQADSPLHHQLDHTINSKG